MDVLDALRCRRSIRRFIPKKVEEDKIQALLDAFFWAPSAGNLQARDVVVVQDGSLKQQLAEAAFGQGFIAESPLVFVVCANKKKITPYGERGVSLYCLQDAAAGVENILLAAVSLGLGSCWVGAFDEAHVAKILGLPGHVRPVALIPVGYPAEQPSPPQRNSSVHRDGW